MGRGNACWNVSRFAIGSPPPYMVRFRRGVFGIEAAPRSGKAPLKRGLSAELTGGFSPNVPPKKTPGIPFGHASSLSRGDRAGEGDPTANLETSRHSLPRPSDHPRKAPCRREWKVSSIAHGRQQAGESRVGSRSAEARGRQGTGLDGKGILKDHGSLSRSLVTFCRRRKSLALRRNRRRCFHDRPPDAGRVHGTLFGGHRGRSPRPHSAAARRAAMAPATSSFP